MEQIYQQKIEESMNKAIPTIAYYSSIGLLTGSILETIMPEFNENKDSVALILEIFAQSLTTLNIESIESSKPNKKQLSNCGLFVPALNNVGVA